MTTNGTLNGLLARWALTALTALALVTTGARADEDLSRFLRDSVEVDTGRYGGTEMLTDFPMLLRLDASRIRGYDAARAGTGGENLRFQFVEFDPAGGTNLAARLVPHEIDTWDENGTSLVWVKMPKLRRASTNYRLVMFWNAKANVTLPPNDPAAVWSDYVAVKHLGDAADSAGGAEGEIGRTAAYFDTGAIGRTLGTRAASTNDFLLRFGATPAIDALAADGFTASMWVRPYTMDPEGDGVLVTRKARWGEAAWSAGFKGSPRTLRQMPGTFENEEDDLDDISLFGASWTRLGEKGVKAGEWTKLDLVFHNGFLEAWLNGKCLGRQKSDLWEIGNGPCDPACLALGGYTSTNAVIGSVTTNGYDVVTTNLETEVVTTNFVVTGVTTNFVAVTNGLFVGDVDEFRLRPGLVVGAGYEPTSGSVDSRLEADYKQVTIDDFWTYGEVKRDGKTLNYWATEPSLSKSVWREGEKPATVSLGLAGHGAAVALYQNVKTGVSYDVMPTGEGTYRAIFTVPEDEDSSGVYTSISLTLGFQIEAGKESAAYATTKDFTYAATLEVTNRFGTAALMNFPMLVRIANNEPQGFFYDKLVFGQSQEEAASDMRFYDHDGTSLDYEIEVWNPRGESLVWVLVPVYDVGTTVTMCWGQKAGTTLPPVDPMRVWQKYIAVYHMNETITEPETIGTAVSSDATGHGHDAVPMEHPNVASSNIRAMKSTAGMIGNGRVINDSTLMPGNLLRLNDTEKLDLGDEFTVSGWYRIMAPGTSSGRGNQQHFILASRARAASEAAESQRAMDWRMHLCLEAGGNGTSWYNNLNGSFDGVNDDPWFGDGSRVFFYNDDGSSRYEYPRASNFWRGNLWASGAYNNGQGPGKVPYGQYVEWVYMTVTFKKPQSVIVRLRHKFGGGDKEEIKLNGPFGLDTGMPIELGGDSSLDPANVWYSRVNEAQLKFLNGCMDEVRLFRGGIDSAWVDTEHAQSQSYGSQYVWGAVEEDRTRPMQNRWIVKPSLSKTVWAPDEAPGEIGVGSTFGGPSIGWHVVFVNRNTGAITDTLPTEEGEYRAVFTTEATTDWGSLEETVNFSIGKDRGSYGHGAGSARTLLANDDDSIAGAEVLFQSYTDTDPDWDGPFWTHRTVKGEPDDSDRDYTSTSVEYNLMGGVVHEYFDANTNRLWGLMNVRVGNQFPNAVTYPDRRRGERTLFEDHNYLPWNGASYPMTGDPFEIGDNREFAGTMLLRNSVGVIGQETPAEICSSLYPDGIGTIYFDAVNGRADNVTNEFGEACYRLEVQVASVTQISGEVADDVRIASTSEDYYDPYLLAEWKSVPMNVIKFCDGEEAYFTTTSLALDITSGGTCENFYRVCVPVNGKGPQRFRIVRTAIDPRYTVDPDNAFIVVDNVICSEPVNFARVEPYGFYDPTKREKQILGREIAFNPPFPGAGDRVTVRARALDRDDVDITNAGKFKAVTMHYRWHYLTQAYTDWQVVDFDVSNLRGQSSLVLPGQPGDIEFWFESAQDGAYYRYADYSGKGLGTPGYREMPVSVTNGWNGAKADWFVRLREGASDIESMTVVVRSPVSKTVDPSGYLTTDFPMELIGEGVWRCYYPTTNAIERGVEVRIERRNLQKAGSTEFQWNTNCYVSTEAMQTTPYVTRLVETDAASWMHMPVDALSGHLLMQYEEKTRGFSVIHADYQNFNTWTDANGPCFVGSSADTNDTRHMAGASTLAKVHALDLKGLSPMATVKTNWCENFTFESNIPDFGWKASRKGYGSFDYGLGRFWYAGYEDPLLDYAYQLAGQSLGTMELIAAGDHPQGIESVKFSARVQQEIDFSQFAVLEDAAAKKNYTFMARGVFDTERNQSFTGRATLSLCGYYRSSKGCYEARWEQVDGLHVNTGGGRWDGHYWNYNLGAKSNGQRLTLYRWQPGKSGMEAVKLISVKNGDDADDGERKASWSMEMEPATGTSDHLLGFFISCYETNNNTYVFAGVKRGAVKSGEAVKNFDGNDWLTLGFVDNSQERLRSGSYGVQTANSDGHLVGLQVANGHPRLTEANLPMLKKRIGVDDRDKPILDDEGNPIPGRYERKWIYVDVGRGTGAAFQQRNLSEEDIRERHLKFSHLNWEYCADETGEMPDLWSVPPVRLQRFSYDNRRDRAGFRAAPPYQTLTLQIAEAPSGATVRDGRWTISEDDWHDYQTVEIADFGRLSLTWDTREIGVFESKLSTVRFVTGGTPGDLARTDVVIDNVSVGQWGGLTEAVADYAGTPDQRPLLPNEPYPENFAYTYAWVKNDCIELNAGRGSASLNDFPVGLRAPIFDGWRGRGSGIGHFGFTYGNVQNADWLGDTPLLLVQLATNITEIQLYNYTKAQETTEDGWQTVASYTVRDLVDGYGPGTSRGAADIYFTGLHGVQALARVIVNPAVVKMATEVSDRSYYASVDIYRVSAKDEPPLDAGCWWGWNLRTVGGSPYDAEGRMYLPDAAVPMAPGSGMSLALNNSITNGVDSAACLDDPLVFAKNKPFIQSPTFTNALVGEISFKARKYDGSASSQTAELRLYGATAETLLGKAPWVELESFEIPNVLFFENYTYRCKPDDSYCAFRLAVTGVKGVLDLQGRVEDDTANPPSRFGAEPARVLLDEIVVGEQNRARMAFRNVGVFRSNLSGKMPIPDMPSRSEQPICMEGIGVQAELYSITLSDEIDWSREPKVTLHWFKGRYPWGFRNWKDAPGAHHALLTRATGGGYVYRSSYLGAADSVITMLREPDAVQYMLEAEYWVIDKKTGKSEPMTTVMSVTAGDWKRPDWLRPLDYNADYALEAEDCVAWTVVENIAPGWAWINEVNLNADTSAENGLVNTDEDKQFFEIAAPMIADMTDWKIYTLDLNGYRYGPVITNVIAVFGEGEGYVKPEKSIGVESNMVFYVVANAKANHAVLDPADGRLDGTWQFSQRGFLLDNLAKGVISAIQPFGVQLVSPMGVVYHECTVCGNDVLRAWETIYEVDKVAEYLNALGDAQFLSLPCDNGGVTNSLSVLEASGGESDNWKNTVVMTPGRINRGQQIDGTPPEPNGESVVIYSKVDTEGGHIEQYVQDLDVWTNAMQVYIAKRDGAGTNLLYRTGDWYELGDVLQNGTPVTDREQLDAKGRIWRVPVGWGLDSSATVVAYARPEEKLRKEWGIDEENPYTPAVMDWLSGGQSAEGRPFKGDEIVPAKFVEGSSVTNLDLTSRYWLDIDPTESNWVFRTAFAPHSEREMTYDGATITNKRFKLTMTITNEFSGEHWAPRYLRGLGGERSDVVGARNWTSETFQVRGNLTIDGYERPSWNTGMPLRWFVFDGNTFDRDDSALIEIYSPTGASCSPAYVSWNTWIEQNREKLEREGKKLITSYGWWLNQLFVAGYPVEMMSTTNFYYSAED